MLVDFVALVIIVALIFDFINGFHDSANAIATVVATRVLTPLKAVIMAGFFNFVGPFIFSLQIATTIGSGILETKFVTPSLVFGALIGAITWNLLTWWLGLPSSSSHALVGGLVGAALAAAGPAAVKAPEWHEARDIARFIGWGVLGGIGMGLFLWVWSRTKMPRGLMPFFGAAGAVAFLLFSVQHTDYAKLDHWGPGQPITEFFTTARDWAKPVLVNLVYATFGLIMGLFLWGASQQRFSIRDVGIMVLPGAFAAVGVAVLLKWITMGGLTKTILFMFVSPFLAFFMGFVMTSVLQWVWRDTTTTKVHKVSRHMQLGSSAFYALMHGTNDAQKTMGLIGALMLAQGTIGMNAHTGQLDIPSWVIFTSALAMGLGTMFGGWKIVKTMASRITHLTPAQGFAAESGGGVVLVGMAESGIPVSTTHAISGAIMGVGATRRASAVRWAVGRQMFIAWILTIPASALVAAISYYVLEFAIAVLPP